MLIYILGKNAVDSYDSFKLSGEGIQYASVKQKFKDDSLIQVYSSVFKMWRYFLGVSKIPNKKEASEECQTPRKADSKDYEKTRSRKFTLTRKVSRPCIPLPWLICIWWTYRTCRNCFGESITISTGKSILEDQQWSERLVWKKVALWEQGKWKEDLLIISLLHLYRPKQNSCTIIFI